MSEVRAAAMAWGEAGFCVLPLRADGSKSPDVAWRCYNQAKDSAVVPAAPSMQIVDRWFAQDRHGLGLIMGAVSGNTEMFEFEGRALDEGLLPKFVELARANGAEAIWDKLNGAYVERTPSGGLHFIYRVDGRATRNVELARRPATDEEMAANPQNPIRMLIEVIGEGGHTIVAPSGRDSHPTKKPWVLLKGTPGVVATLSVAERDLLHDVARMLDTLPAYVRTEMPKRERGDGVGELPGDAFAASTDWADILEPEGWTYVSQKGDYTYWLRPGKEAAGAKEWGCSASTGGGYDGQDFLRVWSTSTTLETDVDHSKFYVWAHYNTGGDLKEAAADLRSQGFGDQRSPEEYRASLVVPGCIDPFSDGFDPAAWAAQRALANVSTAGPVPTAGPEALAGVGKFEALDWMALSTEDYVQEWVVEGFLPARRAMALYSAPKLGKSLLMLEMAAHISMGTEFLGMRTTKTRVLYFDHENDPRGDIWPRLRAMGFKAEDLDNLKVLSFPQMATLDTEAGGQDMARAVAQFNAGLVIIDTVSRTIKGEENSNDTWLALYRHTGAFLKAAEIPYIRLDHTGKDESKGQRGGSAKSGDVDAIWQLIGLGDRKFMLKLDGGRMTFPSEYLTFKRESGPLRSRPDRVRAADGTFAQEVDTQIRIAGAIIGLLKVPDTELNKTQIKENVGGKDVVKMEVLERLKADGHVLSKPSGKSTIYLLNPDRPDTWTPENPFKIN